jgi:hypothetical protein
MTRALRAFGRFVEALFVWDFNPVGAFVDRVSEPIARRMIKLGEAMGRLAKRSRKSRRNADAEP